MGVKHFEVGCSCPYRKSDPNAPVMQSAEMRLCEDPTDAACSM
jgi:hypothetical protein